MPWDVYMIPTKIDYDLYQTSLTPLPWTSPKAHLNSSPSSLYSVKKIKSEPEVNESKKKVLVIPDSPGTEANVASVDRTQYLQIS